MIPPPPNRKFHPTFLFNSKEYCGSSGLDGGMRSTECHSSCIPMRLYSYSYSRIATVMLWATTRNAAGGRAGWWVVPTALQSLRGGRRSSYGSPPARWPTTHDERADAVDIRSITPRLRAWRRRAKRPRCLIRHGRSVCPSRAAARCLSCIGRVDMIYAAAIIAIPAAPL